MTVPDLDTFRALLTNQGLALSEERLEQALAVHVAMRPDLERLRRVELSYLEPVFEPGTAIQWIERGGEVT